MNAPVTADSLGWAFTGALNSRAHVAISEPYQTTALCGVYVAGGLTEIRPPASGWCPNCTREMRARGIDPFHVGIESGLA